MILTNDIHLVTNYESYATLSIYGIVIAGPKPSWSCGYSQNAFFSLYIQKVNLQTRYFKSSTYMPKLPVFNKRRDIIAFNGNGVGKTPIHIYHIHGLNTDRN